MKKWYVIATKSGQEHIAMRNLENQRFKVFCPYIPADKRLNKSERPLFPGYIFVQLDDQGQDWSPIRSTIGVIKLVSPAIHIPPQPLPKNFISELVDAQLFKFLNIDFVDYKPGDRVRFKSGPFSLLTGIVDKPGSERVRILMQIMSNKTTAIVSYDDIEPVKVG